MTEPGPDQGSPITASGPDKAASGGAAGHDVKEGAFPRLQERAQTQLGFINNLLVPLAIGLLAFAANASASSTELDRLGWRKWLLFVGLVVLALSVLSGLRLAFNRLVLIASPPVSQESASSVTGTAPNIARTSYTGLSASCFLPDLGEGGREIATGSTSPSNHMAAP